MTDLTFYTNPMSRGRIARWMLEELGEPYEAVLLEYGTSMKSADYLAVNPMGKVPAVRHGEVVVTECAAICTYLADAYPQAGLAPTVDDPRRGAYLRWMFFGAGPVEAAVTDHSMGWTPKGPKQEGRVGYGTLGRVTDTLEALVSEGGPWLLGEQFTALDVYLGSQIAWGQAFGTMEKRPGFAAYVERLTSRPAAVKAKQIDDALMA
ncbi:MAG: glutathione S-transferase family protein [Myxococcota bacterium]